MVLRHVGRILLRSDISYLISGIGKSPRYQTYFYPPCEAMYCSNPEHFLQTIVETNKRAGVDDDLIDLIESYAALRLARNREIDFFNGARPVAQNDYVLTSFLARNTDLDERTKSFLTAYFQEMRDARLTCVLNRTHLASMLGTSLTELYQLTRNPGRHYHIFHIGKSDGKKREIQAPVAKLKTVQRKILDTILHPVPLNNHAEGFRPGRSIVSNAGHHMGNTIVLKMDLHQFFPSISSHRVHGMFASLGYPRQVARLLSDLSCLNDALPTGAPTSPAIANILCRRLDKRFVNLGRKTGFSYSRYADDLTISGNEEHIVKMIPFYREIIDQEGFRMNEGKLRILRSGKRQTVTGLVVNEKPNISKNTRKMLRAVLHNCRQGDIHQQRVRWVTEHKRLPADIYYSTDSFKRALLANIHFVKMVNPTEGHKLLSSYYAVQWPV